jgi:hypothetical protein
MSMMLEDTLSVNTATVDIPGVSFVPSLFQVRVIGPLALVGFQLLVVMFSVNDTPLPVFLTYTVLFTLPPGVSAPQSIDVTLMVQALSEYMPMFADIEIEPEELKVLFTETAPYVVIVSTKPATIKAITVVIDSFCFAIFIPTT